MKNPILFEILVTLLALVNILPVSAQTWQWSHHLGSDRDEKVIAATDKYGNIYMAGVFYGYYFHSVNQTLTRRGGAGLFLAKYDLQGNEEWIRQLDTYGSSGIPKPDGYIFNIVTGDDGCVYITGFSSETKIFESCTLYSHGGDMFLVKFAPDGSCRWAKGAYGTQDVNGSSIAIDSLNNVYVFGCSRSTALFDTISVDAGGFLAKYDSTGEVLWARNITPVSTLYSDRPPQVVFSAMKVSDGKLFASGREYSYSVTVDTATRTHPDMMGNALCCFDLAGNIQWMREGISPVTGAGNNLSSDRSGNIFICGDFLRSVDFDGTILNTGLYQHDYFVCKYSENGVFQWAEQSYTTEYANANSVLSDSTGNIYLTGSFWSSARFGSDTVVSDSAKDMFLVRYNPDGQFLGMVHFGNGEGKSVGMDASGNPVVIGTFFKNITIGQNTYINFSKWEEDIFIAKCGPITGSGEPKEAGEERLVIYANPGDGKCTVVLPAEFRHERKLTLTIYNNQGQLLQQMPVVMEGDRVAVDISAEARGVYHAILTNGKKSFSGKIVFR